MNQQGLMVADGDGVRAELPIPGETWQSNALNGLIPLLERHGYRVVDGSVGVAGLDVRRGGETFTELRP